MMNIKRHRAWKKQQSDPQKVSIKDFKGPFAAFEYL